VVNLATKHSLDKAVLVLAPNLVLPVAVKMVLFVKRSKKDLKFAIPSHLLSVDHVIHLVLVVRRLDA